MLLNRAIKNSSFNMIAQVFTLLLGLLFSGMTIRYLGPSLAGFFIIASSLLSWVQMAGAGAFQAPCVLRLAKLVLVKDWLKSRTIVRTVTSANILIALPFALATIIAFPVLFSWSKLDNSYYNEGFIVVLFGSISFLLDQWDGSLRAVYDGHQRFDISSYTSIFIGVFGNLVKLLVLLLFHDMVSLAIAFLCISVVRLAIDMFFVSKLIGGGVIPGWKSGILKPMISFGVWNWLGNTNNVIYFNVTGLILARSLGSAVLPYVALPQSIVLQIGQFIISCSAFLFPTLAGQGDQVLRDIIRIEDRMRWFLAVISIAIFGGLFLAGPWLLTFLVNSEFEQKALLPLLLYCLYGIVWAQEVVYVFSALALGRPKASVLTGLVTSALTIATLIILIPHLGYISICVAQLWRIPGTIIFTVLVQKTLGLKQTFTEAFSPYYSSTFGLMAWCGLVYTSQIIISDSFWVQIPVFFIGFVFYCLVVYKVELTFFTLKERLSTMTRALAMVSEKLPFLKFTTKNL